jgi:hypothetical protein
MDFRNPFPQSVVVVARVQIRVHLQEAAVEGLRLVTERDGLCQALAGSGVILYRLTWNDPTGDRVDDMVVPVVVHVISRIAAAILNTHYYPYLGNA